MSNTKLVSLMCIALSLVLVGCGNGDISKSDEEALKTKMSKPMTQDGTAPAAAKTAGGPPVGGPPADAKPKGEVGQ